jgi:hypothetical protein
VLHREDGGLEERIAVAILVENCVGAMIKEKWWRWNGRWLMYGGWQGLARVQKAFGTMTRAKYGL